MSLKTTRAEGTAQVTIDPQKCNACGQCVRVCKGGPLYMAGGQVQVDQSRYFGCIACGHCVAICPSGGIAVEGRDLSPADVLPLPPRDQRSAYAPLRNLMLARRSVRQFQDRSVPRESIERILDAASTAPMGLPPTEVGVLVLEGKQAVRHFRDDVFKVLKSWSWFMNSRAVMAIMRPFMHREDFEMYRDFVGPAIGAYDEKDREGVDWIFYDAPLALCFYGSAYSDPADPVIAATYAVLAAEALGLGSCMLGFPGYALKYDRKLRKKYGLQGRIQPGIVVIFGYPALTYQHAIRRRLARIDYCN